MLGELVSVQTDDRVRLDGFYVESQNSQIADVDLAILVHGLSGNFYKSKFLKHLASVLLNQGISVVLVNTRGHDYLNATPKMGKTSTLGAAVEVVSECEFDLFAWSEFGKNLGHRKIVFVGHSLGAIKSLYAQNHRPHPNVTGIVAFSPTKLSYDSLAESEGGERFLFWIEKAQQMTASGMGHEFIQVDFPFPTWMSAEAYLAKYGERNRYDWLSFADQIMTPSLCLFGQREMENNSAFKVMARELRQISLPQMKINYIPNADHYYSACYDAASMAMSQWIHSTFGNE